jgi:class I fructose-bisphosphate aldolase
LILEEVRAIKEGDFGSIIGRNSFQCPREEALKLLHEITEIYKS